MNALQRITATIAVACALPATSATALADVPLSVSLGAQFPTSARAQDVGGDDQLGVGLNYDVLHAPIVPVQASLTFDEASGSNGDSSLGEYGFGIAARLTTPLYVGAGIGIDNVNATYHFLLGSVTQSDSATGLGTRIFVGDRFLTLPGGASLSLQATYQQLPSVAGINPSAFGVGLRAQL